MPLDKAQVVNTPPDREPARMILFYDPDERAFRSLANFRPSGWEAAILALCSENVQS